MSKKAKSVKEKVSVKAVKEDHRQATVVLSLFDDSSQDGSKRRDKHKPEQLTDDTFIPDELKRQNRWVIWKLRPARVPGRHADKLPFDPKTGWPASTTDPKTWASFKVAKRNRAKYGCNGLGFVLGGGYVGLDVDDMQKELAEYALNPGGNPNNIFFRLGLLTNGTYNEVSQSGTGEHYILKADKPEGTRCRRGHYELYSKGRFFALTGLMLMPHNYEIKTLSDAEMSELMKFTVGTDKIINNQKTPGQSKLPGKDDSMGHDLTPQETIDAMLASKQGPKLSRLMNGDRTGYSSWSEADMALCDGLAYWTNLDGPKIDKIFRMSGLMRPKWDERRGDTTYGWYTISKALSFVKFGYKPKGYRAKDGKTKPKH